MIFLKIYCVFCIVIFLLMEICIYEGIQKIKRKYADKIEENKNKAKANILETLCVHIRIFVTCFVPIVNLGMFWSVLFNGVQVQENMMRKADDEIKGSVQQMIIGNKSTITVVNLPSYIICYCPHCGSEIKIQYSDFLGMMSEYYYGDWVGGTFECPECEGEIEIKDVEWD